MIKTCLVDTPIASKDSDQLNVSLYIDALKEFLAEADTPLTVAIQGEWGSGKTSFMNQLSEELCNNTILNDGNFKESPYFGIWVHAWEYALLNDQSDILINLMNGIIREIRVEVGRYVPENSNVNKYCRMALDITKKLATATCYVAAAHMGVSDESMSKILETRAEEKEDVGIGELKQALRDAIAAGLTALPKKKGFIFFIDDLDRLDPVIAVNFLELVKNIFDLPQCIFVLAIDYDVVVRGLKPRFGERTEKNDREFRYFFDKIIQMPFSVPMASYDLENYLDGVLRSIGFFTEEEERLLIPLDDTKAFFPPPLDSDEKSRERYAIDIIVYLTECSVGNNPRSIKRLVNVLSLLNKIQRKKYLLEQNAPHDEELDVGKITEKVILYALVSLQVAYSSIYEFLATTPGFTMWTEEDAVEQGYKRFDSDERALLDKEDCIFNPGFEQVIYQICRNDSYLKSKSHVILLIFRILRGLILSSDHKKLFGTGDIEHIELLDKYNPSILYEYLDEDEVVDESLLPEISEQDQQYLQDIINDIIVHALDKFLSVSGMTSIESSPSISERRPELRSYTKQKVYDSLEEYEEHLPKGCDASLKLFKELKKKLDETFGEGKLIRYEYKDGGTVNVRPVHRKKGKGLPPVFLSCVPLTKSPKKRMKITYQNENIYLSDSIDPLLAVWSELIVYFNEEISRKPVDKYL